MTFGAVFPRVFRPAFGPGLAGVAAGVNWWEAGGATGAVAVYQPKGAASLAASYTNLANPGTYDAAPGVAPSWNTATGWTFATASSQYLTTGITPVSDQSWSMIIQVSSVAAADGVAIGSRLGGNTWFALIPNNFNTNVSVGNGNVVNNSPVMTAGNLAVAGSSAYRNGTAYSTSIGAWAGAAGTVLIGALNGAVISRYLSGTIVAAAIYNTTLTAPQVAAVSTAMAAL